MALCEALYPLLHGLEVALRNGIHSAACIHFGDELWMDDGHGVIFDKEAEPV